MTSSVALIAWPGDTIADAVEGVLEDRAVPTLRIEPGSLAGLRATLEGQDLVVDDRPVGGILWRARPDGRFAEDFVEDDQFFVSVETRGFWLAALQASTVRAPVRPEASDFFTSDGWLLWRVRLSRSVVRLAALTHGVSDMEGPWLPQQHTDLRPGPGGKAIAALGATIPHRAKGGRALIVGTDVRATPELDGCDNLSAVVDALRARDVRFAEVVFDDEEHLLWVNLFPAVLDPEWVAWAAPRLADLLH